MLYAFRAGSVAFPPPTSGSVSLPDDGKTCKPLHRDGAGTRRRGRLRYGGGGVPFKARANATRLDPAEMSSGRPALPAGRRTFQRRRLVGGEQRASASALT